MAESRSLLDGATEENLILQQKIDDLSAKLASSSTNQTTDFHEIRKRLADAERKFEEISSEKEQLATVRAELEQHLREIQVPREKTIKKFPNMENFTLFLVLFLVSL